MHITHVVNVLISPKDDHLKIDDGPFLARKLLSDRLGIITSQVLAMRRRSASVHYRCYGPNNNAFDTFLR